VYARELAKKMELHGTRAYLVNTGWFGGPYGVGTRIDIDVTRAIVRAILSGALERLEESDLMTLPVFNLAVPNHIPGVQARQLNPRSAWKRPEDWDQNAVKLARSFVESFERFTDTPLGRELTAAGPLLPGSV